MIENKDTTKIFYNKKAEDYNAIFARPLLKYTFKKEREILEKYLNSNQKILDTACGNGRIAVYMAQKTNNKVYATDFSYKMIKVAQENQKKHNHNVEYFVDDMTAMQFADNSFDLITCFTGLNYISKIDLAFKEIKRILKKDGLFIMEVINKNELMRIWRQIYLFPYYLLKALNLWPYKWFKKKYGKKKIIGLLKENDFEIIEYRGLRMLPDIIPAIPFDYLFFLFPITNAVLKIFEPLDEKLTTNKVMARYSRFHFIISINKK